MKTENKQYRLNRWYPTLPNDWKTEHDYVYYKEESLMVNKLLMTTHIINFKHLEYRDFWELIEDEKPKPLFITEDGVEVFLNNVELFAVNEIFETASAINFDFDCCKKEGWKLFFHKANADEYIWKNKRVFSYEDIIEHAYNKPKYRSFIEKLAIERVNGTNQEFIDNVDYAREYLKEKIDGRCPKCGGELEYSHIDRVLLSSPPQRQINCTKCAHVGYLIIGRSEE